MNNTIITRGNSHPPTAIDGQMYYNTFDGGVYIFAGGSWRSVSSITKEDVWERCLEIEAERRKDEPVSKNGFRYAFGWSSAI